MNLIEDVDISDRRISVRADPAFNRAYLLGDFFVQYDQDTGIDRMDRTVALAPFVLNMAPLVWFSDRDWRIDALDRDLSEALESIVPVFRTLYPRHRWAGRLLSDRLVDNRPAADGEAADVEGNLLFTGGVDSVYTCLFHHPRRHNLLTVWGNETALDFESKWQTFRDHAESFARQFGHRNTFIKTNGKEIVRRKSVRPDIPVWWANVQMGMALPGLCLPVLHHDGGGQVMISSSQWEGCENAWGTLPEIDDKVRCAGIAVSHEGFRQTRQDKLDFIVAKCRDEGLAFPHLVVCSRPYIAELNCERCEKCLRTMTGIVVAGGDPRDFGFAASVPDIQRRVQDACAHRRLVMKLTELYKWEDIQAHARVALDEGPADLRSGEAAPFLRWLVEHNFTAYARAYLHKHRWENRAKRVLGISPTLFEFVKNAIERRSLFGY